MIKKKNATLFIDESGKASLLEKSDEPFLITGVILDDQEIKVIEGFFTYIKLKYSIPVNKPFHSYHIYECSDTRISDGQALKLSQALADFISFIPISIKVVEVNKSDFRLALGIKSDNDFKGSRERKEMRTYPYRVMIADLFQWFAHRIEKGNYIGQVIADARRGGDQQVLKTLSLCKEGHHNFKDKAASGMIKDRISAICFAEKNYLSGGLEITDLISYVIFFRRRRLLSENKHIGLDLIWKQIRKKLDFEVIDEIQVRRFFRIKKGEVHKYLKYLKISVDLTQR